MDHCGEALIGFVAAPRYPLELLEFAEKILDQVPPFVNFRVDFERLRPSRVLRDNDFCTAFVECLHDPIGVERFVGDQAAEIDAFDQRTTPTVS